MSGRWFEQHHDIAYPLGMMLGGACAADATALNVKLLSVTT